MLQGSILRKYSVEMSGGGKVGEFDRNWRVASLQTGTRLDFPSQLFLVMFLFCLCVAD